MDSSEIIYNYDIIPAVYLKCDTEELLNQKENLEQFAVIKNVFKSKTYSLPYINDDLPETSALNKNSYPNWWVSAVGADNLVYDGSGIKVAVIDTGIYEHPDLNIGAARSFVSDELPSEYQDDYGHGTHVAGIIGSNGYSSGGTYRGIAPGVTLINAKAGSLSSFDDGDIINAIQWSVNTEAVDIISMSFGDINPVANDPLTLALSAATDNGVICVSSAGNSGPSYISGGSPASGIDVISVGASDSNNNLASFSSWGPTYSYLNYPDIVAPGVNIISTEAPKSLISDEKRFVGDYFDFSGDADYIPLSGTSMSCPMVAGALAILKQAYPNLTPETARIALLEGASKLLNEDDNDEMKSGFGLINISNSLNFLNQVNITHPNINDIAIIAPKELPVAPFDLLNFPGDSQLYNLTVISGDTNNFNINIPSKVDGLTLTTDKSQLSFTDAGVSFIGLQIDINHNAMPGLRLFTLNMTSGADLYYEINISISIKYPEFRILLDSYHGLNDWSPLASVYQMSFYDWMRDITDMDIAIDYLAEYWTPNYNKSLDNSLLTEEKLAQYDIVVLQNPIIPYTPLEITNLKNYYENGGNILFLGTRYQDMCLENLATLEVDIQIENNDLIDENWLGIGASVDPQVISQLNDSIIFNGVANFLWNYGATLAVSGEAKSIATKDGDVVAASYNGNSVGKGKFVIFGDLDWASVLYNSYGYYTNHRNLSHNLMNYLLEPNSTAMNILLNSASSSSPNVNISIYAKDLLTDTLIDPATLNTYLNVSITNSGFYDEILITSVNDGLAYNYSYSLPFTSPNPYEIKVNLSINSQIFTKTSKILYYNDTEIPQITNIAYTSSIERNGIDSLDIDVYLNDVDYNSSIYLAIYPSSFYSKSGTLNKTLILNNSLPNLFKYSLSYTPLSTDPAGLVIFFTLPQNPISDYINPNSPRSISLINNNPPKFNEDYSSILIDNSRYLVLSDTHDNKTLNAYSASQGSIMEFNINVSDSVTYEDQNSSNMIVSVNFLMATITQTNSLAPLDPITFINSKLSYNANSGNFRGSFTIPTEMKYSSIAGTKSISTVSTYSNEVQDGYIGLILITVFDSDGGSDDFIVVFLIQAGFDFSLILPIVIISLIIIAGLSFIIFTHFRRKKRAKSPISQPYYIQQESGESMTSDSSNMYYCPFCGERLTGLRNFCPSCGKSLNFKE